MTEHEWHAATEPEPMLAFLRGRASARKLRLFACACCRRHAHLLVPETLAALEVAERFADGSVPTPERKRAREEALHAGWCPDPATAHRRGPAKACVAAALSRRAYDAAIRVDHLARHIGVMEKRDWDANDYEVTEHGPRLRPTAWSSGRSEQAARQARTLRELFGSLPFCPITLDQSWLTATVKALAQHVYESRDFSAVPILADAIQDAGCDNADILTHLRDANATHVPGCWALDLVLGKE